MHACIGGSVVSIVGESAVVANRPCVGAVASVPVGLCSNGQIVAGVAG